MDPHHTPGLPDAIDLLGYLAGALVLLAFSLRSLIALRSVAIASNVAFIAYAAGAHLPPVLILHAALLPLNIWRLWQCLHAQRNCCSDPDRRNPESTRLTLRGSS